MAADLLHPTFAGPRLSPQGCTVWLTGLPAAGKTTLGRALVGEVMRAQRRSCLLDGDRLRETINRGLGFSREGRSEAARRAAALAADIASAGIVAVVAMVSPFSEDRASAKALHEWAGVRFCEVHVDTPYHVCLRRDPKGLYARACAGTLRGLTGVDAPYEPPASPDVHIGIDMPWAVAVATMMAWLSDDRPAGPIGLWTGGRHPPSRDPAVHDRGEKFYAAGAPRRVRRDANPGRGLRTE